MILFPFNLVLLAGHVGSRTGDDKCNDQPAHEEQGDHITFTSFVQSETTAPGTIKGNGIGWGRSGCVSSRSINEDSNLIGFSFTPGQLAPSYMVGLDSATSRYFNHYRSISYAFYLTNGNVLVYENGTHRYNGLVRFDVEDVFEIRVNHDSKVPGCNFGLTDINTCV